MVDGLAQSGDVGERGMRVPGDVHGHELEGIVAFFFAAPVCEGLLVALDGGHVLGDGRNFAPAAGLDAIHRLLAVDFELA